MKRSALAAVFPLMLAGAFAVGDDTMPNASPTDSQRIKTCMEQQKSNTNVTMSEAQLKRYCQDQLKQQKATGEMPQQPPTDLPKDDTPHG
jgi:hypothetical protein